MRLEPREDRDATIRDRSSKRSTMSPIIPRRGVLRLIYNRPGAACLIIKRQFPIGFVDVGVRAPYARAPERTACLHILDGAVRCMRRLRRIEDAKENQLAGQTVSTAAVCPRESCRCVSSRDRIRVPVHVARAHAVAHIHTGLYVCDRRSVPRRSGAHTNPCNDPTRTRICTYETRIRNSTGN